MLKPTRKWAGAQSTRELGEGTRHTRLSTTPPKGMKTIKITLILLVMAVILSFRLRPRTILTPWIPESTATLPISEPDGIEGANTEDVAYRPYCRNFVSPPRGLSFAEVYALEWNSTPAISDEMNDVKTQSFQTTQFTSHVDQLVSLIDLKQMEDDCVATFTLIVNKPYSIPVDLSCKGKARHRMVPWWCAVLERLFLRNSTTRSEPIPRSAILVSSTRGNALHPVLPRSVTFAVSSDDFYKRPRTRRSRHEESHNEPSPYTCLANSSPQRNVCNHKLPGTSTYGRLYHLSHTSLA